MLGEIVMVRASLMRSQIAIRNKLLATERKTILVIKWRGSWLNCAVSLCLVEGRTVPNEIGYLAETTSKPSVEEFGKFSAHPYWKK